MGMASAYQSQLNAEFSKVCGNFKVRSIESLKYVQEFYTRSVIFGDISTPRNMTRKQNETWLVALPVNHMASWAGLGHSEQPEGLHSHSSQIWFSVLFY